MIKIKKMILKLAIALAVMFSPFVAYKYISVENINIKVNKTFDKNLAGTDKYLIGAIKDDGKGEQFENIDDYMFLKFNSSDIFAELEVGKTYNVKVQGIRIGILNKYRNIVSIKSTGQ